MKVLVAEDDKIANKNITDTLTDWGYEVVLVEDGQAAWQALQEEDPPKIAILDWEMPYLSGIEVCQKSRASANDSYTYFIVLTGRNEQADIIEGLQSGADDYLSKPFNPSELHMRLHAGERILNLESRLIDSLNQLQENDRLRTEFVSALTHDLRTPLTAEKRALEVIQGFKDEVSSRVGVLLKSLEQNNSNLLKLVNQLLETFHAEKMEICLNKELADFNKLVEDCFVSVKLLAAEKNIKLSNQVTADLDLLELDTQAIKRVMTNLLGNAITHIPSGSKIEVVTFQRGDFIEVQVRDNGPGISPELLCRLFERYQKGIKKIGCGLGLSICKTIVELHGGKINAKSILDEGTCFYFTLPKALPKLTSLSNKPFSVLIAEDQELVRIGLKFALEVMQPVEVVGMAEDGLQAVSLVENLKPDIVLMDLTMPHLDGVQATKKIKADSPQTKILMFTSQTSPEKVQAALSAGADGYCLKDIKTHRLVEVMQNIMNGQQWLDPGVDSRLRITADCL